MSDLPGPAKPPRPHLEITQHVFANSPTMLALCLSTLGLIKIYASLERITTLLDNFLGFCLILFALSTLLSYLALRSRPGHRRITLARSADAAFLIGLLGAVITSVFLVYSLKG